MHAEDSARDILGSHQQFGGMGAMAFAVGSKLTFADVVVGKVAHIDQGLAIIRRVLVMMTRNRDQYESLSPVLKQLHDGVDVEKLTLAVAEAEQAAATHPETIEQIFKKLVNLDAAIADAKKLPKVSEFRDRLANLCQTIKDGIHETLKAAPPSERPPSPSGRPSGNGA